MNPEPGDGELFRGKLVFWTVTVLGATLDWCSKGAAFAHHLRVQGHVAKEQALRLYESSFISIDLVREYNLGMAFGLMQDVAAGPLILGIARGVVLCFALWLVRRAAPAAWGLQVLVGALAAGALGNLADNLFNFDAEHAHAVRDFVRIAGPTWALPAFNLADAFVTVGGVGLVAMALRRRRPAEPA